MTDDNNSRILHAGDFLQLHRRRHWEYVQRVHSSGGAAFLIATTDADELVLVEQFRLPVQRPVIELPAGIIGDHDPGEATATAAARELEEETGFRAGRIEPLFDAPTAAGLTSEWAWYLRMRDLQRIGDGGGVGDEDITTHCVPIAEVPQWLQQQRQRGVVCDPKIFAALFWLGQEVAAGG